MTETAYVIDQYEALRREALAVAQYAPRGHGLALVIARGLPAWLTALTALTPAWPARGTTQPLAASAVRLLPAARGELTTVLAGMVLACVPETEEGR